MSAARRRRLRISRDSVIFAAGLAGFIYQIIENGTERPTYMIACLFMMGVPAFLGMDESLRDLSSRIKKKPAAVPREIDDQKVES